MSKPPIKYIPNFIEDPLAALLAFEKDLNWVRRETTPRSEYYINDHNVPYSYGSGRGVREYLPQPMHPLIAKVKEKLYKETGYDFEVCFLNRYHDQSDHLGWHSDNSPEMDDNRPIAIISLGVEREIWFCPINDKKDITKVKLETGSLCLMSPGMQDSHLHRIPKAGFSCGERISLTFRGYAKP